MNNILIAIAIGTVAGLVDITPMIIRKLNRRDILSAFIHYFILGLIIPFINWDIAPWIKGIIVSVLTAVPVMIMVYPNNKKAIIPIATFAPLLGAGIGIAGWHFIN